MKTGLIYFPAFFLVLIVLLSCNNSEKTDEFKEEQVIEDIEIDSSFVEVVENEIPETAILILDELTSTEMFGRDDYSILLEEHYEYDAATTMLYYDVNNQLTLYFESKAYEGGEGYEYSWLNKLESEGWDNVTNVELYMPYSFIYGEVGFLQYNIGYNTFYFEVKEKENSYTLHLSEEEQGKEFENELLNIVNELKSNLTNFQQQENVFTFCTMKKKVNSDYGEIEVSRCFKVSNEYFERIK
jgi:hypothetical protein